MQILAQHPDSVTKIVTIGPFYHQNTQILSQISLPLNQGQWTAIIGRSGVGKTTLLRCLAGLEFSAPVFHGLKVSYIPQKDTLLPWKTVAQNIALAPLLQGQQVNQESLYSLLDLIGLKGYENHYPYQLSQGMRQRIGLARALYDEADLILMDEPFSALDGLTRKEIHTSVKKILEGKTVILVTHDIHEASSLAHHIYLLKNRPGTLTALEQHSPEHIWEALVS